MHKEAHEHHYVDVMQTNTSFCMQILLGRYEGWACLLIERASTNKEKGMNNQSLKTHYICRAFTKQIYPNNGSEIRSLLNVQAIVTHKVWKTFSTFSYKTNTLGRERSLSTFLQYDNMYGLYGDELEQMVHFNQSVEMVFQENSSTFNFSSIVCAINVIASSFLTSL